MKPIKILLVEDNEGDILLTTEALEEGQVPVRQSVVRDGKSALDFLKKLTPYHNEFRPDLILLDINLPKYSGLEVLKIIKNDDDLKSIPVIILTTSSSESDINESYLNSANCYITKPVDTVNFNLAMRKVEDFWMSFTKLPTQNI
ncbi:response regulator [Psychroflexus aestuariivivens]|uniref:response regulator n=1 Tax=Psychroflexus aestuariivivens TaxID=1795040 RepID=UPI000FDAD4FC|nr:response regulator [Psychroflexus aestuariivivens]